VVADRLVDGPAPMHQLVSGTRRRMVDGGWQLAVFLTDLPSQTSRRPVVAQASSAHGVAVLSLPAFGAGLESDETVREAAYAYQPDPSLTD